MFKCKVRQMNKSNMNSQHILIEYDSFMNKYIILVVIVNTSITFLRSTCTGAFVV